MKTPVLPIYYRVQSLTLLVPTLLLVLCGCTLAAGTGPTIDTLQVTFITGEDDMRADSKVHLEIWSGGGTGPGPLAERSFYNQTDENGKITHDGFPAHSASVFEWDIPETGAGDIYTLGIHFKNDETHPSDESFLGIPLRPDDWDLRALIITGWSKENPCQRYTIYDRVLISFYTRNRNENLGEFWMAERRVRFPDGAPPGSTLHSTRTSAHLSTAYPRRGLNSTFNGTPTFPMPVAPFNPRIDRLEVSLLTGDDNFREGSTAWLLVWLDDESGAPLKFPLSKDNAVYTPHSLVSHMEGNRREDCLFGSNRCVAFEDLTLNAPLDGVRLWRIKKYAIQFEADGNDDWDLRGVGIRAVPMDIPLPSLYVPTIADVTNYQLKHRFEDSRNQVLVLKPDRSECKTTIEFYPEHATAGEVFSPEEVAKNLATTPLLPLDGSNLAFDNEQLWQQALHLPSDLPRSGINLAFTRAGDDLTVHWSGKAGIVYQVFVSPNLEHWFPISQPLEGRSGTMKFRHSKTLASTPSLFYQVLSDKKG